MFKKKKRIRALEDQRLVEKIEKLKHRLEQQTKYMSHSVDPSYDVQLDVKLTKAKYLFLLKEARFRKGDNGSLS